MASKKKRVSGTVEIRQLKTTTLIMMDINYFDLQRISNSDYRSIISENLRKILIRLTSIHINWTKARNVKFKDYELATLRICFSSRISDPEIHPLLLAFYAELFTN
jgi:hypothetical protein